MHQSRGKLASVEGLLGEADVLLIVPPFADLKFPSLGLHLLQACGQQEGIRVRVFYANLALAATIGEVRYARICHAPTGSFAAERFFARCAYGLRPLGRNSRKMYEATWVIETDTEVEIAADYGAEKPMGVGELKRLEKKTASFVNCVAGAVAAQGYKIVGCTTNFEQTSAAVALLNAIKSRAPETVTILGGANCEGEMAEGIASLRAKIDHIFAGESEVSFPEFARGVMRGSRPTAQIIYGELCRNMDALPTPDYEEFYEQRELFLGESNAAEENSKILFQTSRGCWWGQRQHCTFCGLNGEGMAFRQKSAPRALEELRTLAARHPKRKIAMTDNIMPHEYFKTLLPRIAAELPGLEIFYEIKANLTLENLLALEAAGVTSIQPGIEALSTSLLKRMKKGVQARQNLMLLRNARATGVRISWNLLWGFPGDELEDYACVLRMAPLLHHLQPPASLFHLTIDRFSPYFERPREYGIRRLRPLPGYYDHLPKTADVKRIAYHFLGDYRCGSHDRLDVICKLGQEVSRWRAAWEPDGEKPREDLRIERRQGRCVLVDTRRVIGTRRTVPLEEDEALALLTPRPYSGSGRENWAVEQKLGVIVDGWFVPLAVPDAEILAELASAGDGKEARTASLLVHLEPSQPVSAQAEGN